MVTVTQEGPGSVGFRGLVQGHPACEELAFQSTAINGSISTASATANETGNV